MCGLPFSSIFLPFNTPGFDEESRNPGWELFFEIPSLSQSHRLPCPGSDRLEREILIIITGSSNPGPLVSAVQPTEPRVSASCAFAWSVSNATPYVGCHWVEAR